MLSHGCSSLCASTGLSTLQRTRCIETYTYIYTRTQNTFVDYGNVSWRRRARIPTWQQHTCRCLSATRFPGAAFKSRLPVPWCLCRPAPTKPSLTMLPSCGQMCTLAARIVHCVHARSEHRSSSHACGRGSPLACGLQRAPGALYEMITPGQPIAHGIATSSDPQAVRVSTGRFRRPDHHPVLCTTH